ncbi:MAG: MBL fold metallo-hydrolase [Candidatus Omnitrophica bacterium]|nr:MBL fold metallo-hydrolase [Candidatus Omnitrophota bacterium]
MILETVCVGPLEANCYILAEKEGSTAIIIDPGHEERRIKNALKKHGLNPAFIINTHGHIDHIGCDDKFGVPVYIHSRDERLLNDPGLNLSSLLSAPFKVRSKVLTLEEGQLIENGGLALEVIHTPGHTPGGICLLMKKPKDNILFTGDSLFCQSIGRADFPGADEGSLISALKEKILKLNDDVIIYPGHGPSSTIRDEKRGNPFLR